MRKLLLVVCCLAYSVAVAQTPSSSQLMYVGTLDKKLLVIDEGKEAVVGEIQLTVTCKQTYTSFHSALSSYLPAFVATFL